MDTKTRILNAVKYFENMKPSEFAINGVAHPARWREFQEFLKLVREQLTKWPDMMDVESTIEESVERIFKE